MMINDEKIQQITQAAKSFLWRHPTVSRQYEVSDLVNEGVLIILEGYGGHNLDFAPMYVVQHAAERLQRVDCKELTGHDFSIEEGSVPSGRRNTEDDFVQQTEIDDWVSETLTPMQATIVQLLLIGATRREIAGKLGLAHSTVTDKIKAIQELAKEDFDVN